MSEETSIAVTIGSKIADGALSDGLSFGFDQLLSFAGVDTSGLKEVNAKLDEIIDRLKVLQTSVDELRDYLAAQLDDLAYAAAVAPVLALSDANDHVRQRFADLLAMTDANEIEETKKEIAKAIAEMPNPLQTWHNCLVGGGAHPMSVIHAWGKAVYDKHNTIFGPKVFGPKAAQAIQDQWDYFDAQQASSALFLVNYYNDRKMPDSVFDTINLWQRNRKTQLQLLHANVRALDSVYTLTKGSDGKYTQQVEPVSLACLPSGMIKAGNRLWLQQLINNMPMLWWFGPHINVLKRGTTNGDLSSGFWLAPELFKGAVTDPDSWRLPQLDTLKDLLSNINAQIGQSQDHFAGALAAAEFAPADGTPVYAVWFYEYGENPFRHKTIYTGGRFPITIEDTSQPKWAYSGGFFHENDSWDRFCDNVFQPACIMAYNAHSAALLPAIFGPLLT